MKHFNEYYAATQELVGLEDKITIAVQDFVKDLDPLETRAVINFITSSLDCVASEKTLRFAMDKKAKERL